jgi:hypothetical protein
MAQRPQLAVLGLSRTVCIAAIAASAGYRIDSACCRTVNTSALVIAAGEQPAGRRAEVPARSAHSSRRLLKGGSTRCSASATEKRQIYVSANMRLLAYKSSAFSLCTASEFAWRLVCRVAVACVDQATGG